MKVILTLAEERELQEKTAGQGGFQSLLRRLASRCRYGSLKLTSADLERLPRYAFDYGNGGWENKLMAIFGRSLGKHLGRNPQMELSI